jgi:hypothetical protein
VYEWAILLDENECSYHGTIMIRVVCLPVILCDVDVAVECALFLIVVDYFSGKFSSARWEKLREGGDDCTQKGWTKMGEALW